VTEAGAPTSRVAWSEAGLHCAGPRSDPIDGGERSGQPVVRIRVRARWPRSRPSRLCRWETIHTPWRHRRAFASPRHPKPVLVRRPGIYTDAWPRLGRRERRPVAPREPARSQPVELAGAGTPPEEVARPEPSAQPLNLLNYYDCPRCSSVWPRTSQCGPCNLTRARPRNRQLAPHPPPLPRSRPAKPGCCRRLSVGNGVG
jgi:hypothetical protein